MTYYCCASYRQTDSKRLMSVRIEAVAAAARHLAVVASVQVLAVQCILIAAATATPHRRPAAGKR